MKTVIYNGTLILDEEQKIENGTIVLENGKIVAIYEHEVEILDAEFVDVQGNYVLPGFIDIHIHGAMGKDLIEGTQDSINAVSWNLVKDGCTSFMASLTVLPQDSMLKVLEALGQAHTPQKGANYLGIHEEGPYLSKEYKAVMDEEALRNPSMSELDEMIKHSHHRIRIMTVAPEIAGMDSFISYATKQGITIMLGHTNAKPKDVRIAKECGAKGFTHLYNAMSQHLHRNPGCVSAAMIESDMLCELICDGFHVDRDVVLATYRCFGAKRLVLITDAMLGKGCEDGEYTFSNLRCRKQGKFVRVIDTGRIAGSCIGMNDAAKLMREISGCTMNEIVQMGCVNPSRLAQVDDRKGTIAIGKDADLCVMNTNMEVVKTFVGGKCVYQNE